MKRITVIILLTGLISACAGYQELKAPCSPLNCKNRVPVNSWPAE